VEYAYFVENGIGGKLSLAKAMLWFEKAAKLAIFRRHHAGGGRWYMAQGDGARAKFWLHKGPQHRATLLLVSCMRTAAPCARLTGRSIFVSYQGTAARADRRRTRGVRRQLDKEFRRRNPDAILGAEQSRCGGEA
jgi:hypothetical protein